MAEHSRDNVSSPGKALLTIPEGEFCRNPAGAAGHSQSSRRCISRLCRIEAPVEISLQANRFSLRALGEVRMVDPFGGMGIEFRGMSAGGRLRLRELTSDLHAESGLDAQQATAAAEKPQG